MKEGSSGGAVQAFEDAYILGDKKTTGLLAKHVGEPIEADMLSEIMANGSYGAAVLKVDERDDVLKREILLRGAESNKSFVHAICLIALKRLPEEFLEELTDGDSAIGSMIKKHKIKVKREILDEGEEKAGSRAKYFDLEEEAPMIFRTYRLVVGDDPIMMITERYSAGLLSA